MLSTYVPAVEHPDRGGVAARRIDNRARRGGEDAAKRVRRADVRRSMSVPEIVECSARENIAAGLSALSTEGPCGRLGSVESTASPEAR
jgi:hypothetical protein